MKEDVRMYFDINVAGASASLIPVVIVGTVELRLDKNLYNAEEAKLFLQAFVIGLEVESAENFLQIHAEKQRDKDEADGGPAA